MQAATPRLLDFFNIGITISRGHITSSAPSKFPAQAITDCTRDSDANVNAFIVLMLVATLYLLKFNEKGLARIDNILQELGVRGVHRRMDRVDPWP